MKKLLFAAFALLALNTAHAQEAGKVRVGLDLGYAATKGGGGFLFNLEPKYNLSDNMNVGLRYGIAAVIKAIETDNNGELKSASVSANNSYMGTFDYYFVLGGSFNPYVGGGLGYVSMASVSTDGGTNFGSNGDFKPEGKFGFMLRGGFEANKFRFTLEYDLIGKSKLTDADGNDYGSIKNNYLGITVGFFVGGGQW